MKKTRVIVGTICLILVLCLPSTIAIIPPPIPPANPAIIGNFGQLKVGDSMNYKPIVSSNIESFLESQLFRDYSFVVSLLLANGNFTLANLMAKKIQDIAIGLKDTRINCLITDIVPTNSTFVGRVSGNASLTGVSLTGVWDLLTMVRLVNFTDLVNNYTEFEHRSYAVPRFDILFYGLLYENSQEPEII